MAFRFQLRRDTAINWEAVDPVLLVGELAYETDTGRLKLGDGTSTWNELPYFLATVESVNGQIGIVVLDTDDIAESGPTAANKWFTPQRVANTLLGGENVQISYSPLTEKVTISSPGNVKFPEGIGLTSGAELPIIDEYGTTGSFYIGLTSASSLYRLGVGTTGPRAVLEVTSTDSGILFPRLTELEKNSMPNPIVGMVIYQTDAPEGLYQYKTGGWETIDPGDFSGTTNHVTKFTAANVLGNSIIYDDGTSVSIGASGAHPSALFQLSSTSKGFLSPKMSEGERNLIPGPTSGLLIYNISTNKLNLWDGSKWAPAGGGLKLAGDEDIQSLPLQVQDASDNGSTFYLGATSQGFLGNLGIGTTGPEYILDVRGESRFYPDANTTPLTISGYSLTGTNTQAALDISGTWNTTGTPTLIRANVTDTASNTNSLLMDLLAGGTSQFRVSKSGGVNAVSLNTSGSISADISISSPSITTNSILSVGGNDTSSSGIVRYLGNTNRGFAPISGNAVYNNLEVSNTINQTGGANGITRGLYINPTLTSAADWRSIEWSNNSGWGLYGGGTANNYLNGNLFIGTTTDAGYKLDVNGTARMGSLTVSGNVLSNQTNDGYVYIGGSSRLGNTGGSNIHYASGYYSQAAHQFWGGSAVGMRAVLEIFNTQTTKPSLLVNGRIQTAGSITASSALAQGVHFNNTLVASANNDALVGLDINPTFTNGAFTGVNNIALRSQTGKVIHQGLTAATQTNQVYYNTTTGELTYGALPVVATPTLDQVTTAGNTTTNSITVGGLTVATNLIYTDIVNGRVGIGTISPSEILDVRGAIGVSGPINMGADPSATTQSTAVIRNVTTNSGIAIVPNGTGAITASIPDGTVAGGNARGIYAIDLQLVRTNTNQVAAGRYDFIGGGRSNRTATHLNGHNFIGGGENNSLPYGGHSVIVGGLNNSATVPFGTAASAYLTIGGGFANSVGSFASTVSGGQSNTASTGTHATVVGGQSNTSSGQYSVSGGFSNVASNVGAVALGYDTTASGYASVAIGYQANASGFEAVAIGRGVASGTRTVAIGRDANVSGFDGAIAFVGGQVSGSGEGLGAAAFGRSKTQSIGGFSFGEDSLSYLRNQFSQSPRNIYGGNTIYLGHSQASQVVAIKLDTLDSAATTVLSLDGTGTTNLIIPNGNNRAWKVKVEWVGTVTTISGTATGVTVGDSVYGESNFGFKRIGGTSSMGGMLNDSEAGDTAIMDTCLMSYSAGASQELTLTFTGPTFSGGGSVTMRVVAKVSLVEVAY